MNLIDILQKMKEQNGKRNAYRNKERTITYDELYYIICVNQEKMMNAGIKQGDTVILKEKNQLEFILMFLTLLSLGCYVVPLAYDLNDYELEKAVKATQAKNLLMYQISYDIAAAKINNIIPQRFDEKNSGIYHMTSGSTGSEKFCIRTLDSIIGEGEIYCNTFNCHKEDIILSPAPLNHSYALGAVIFPALLSGACVYTLSGMSPKNVLSVIEECKVSIVILVPVIAKMLCMVRQTYNCSSVRLVLAGAGKVTKQLDERFREKFHIGICGNYGSTETGGLISRAASEDIDSLGSPMPGVYVKVCDENGNELPIGCEGELFVKSKGIMKKYLNGVDNPFDQEGYFGMEDIAVIQENSLVYLKGRKKYFINIGGKKINPIEVENVIHEMSSVKECIVYGVKRNNGDEVVKALVVPEYEVTEKEIRRYCMKKLSVNKIPKQIQFRKEFPRNSAGKIRRQLLIDEDS